MGITIQSLIDLRDDNEKKRAGIIENADANGVMSEDQASEFDTLKAEYGRIEKTIAARQDHTSLIDQLDASPGRLTKPDSDSIDRDANPTSASVGRDRVLDDPKKGFKSHKEFFLAVKSSTECGTITHESLRHLVIRPDNLQYDAAIGSDEQSTFSDSHGGFAVPVGFIPEILRLEPEADPMAGRVLSIPMAQPMVEILARVDKNHSSSVSGGLTVSRREEAGTISSSRMSLEKVVMKAHSLFGLAYSTEELLTDSPASFMAILQAGFQDEFTSHIIDERINGTGAGMFMGVLNSPCLVSITKENNQVADTIVYENIIKMRARAWHYTDAIWMANQDTLPQLMLMNQAVGTGGATVWQPSARDDHPDILFGRPLFFTEYLNTVGDKGDILLANWSQYLEGTLQPLQSAESVHVRFLSHERAFKMWLRNAGAPWWNAPLTPKNSTATLSPFVTLNART